MVGVRETVWRKHVSKQTGWLRHRGEGSRNNHDGVVQFHTNRQFTGRSISAVRVGRKDVVEGGDVVMEVYITKMRYPLSNYVEYKTWVQAPCYPPIYG
jgi:hypothetical protein